MRTLVLILVAIALALPMAACGRKSEVKPPPGQESESDYPRQYPR
jgi:hypothetical protein